MFRALRSHKFYVPLITVAVSVGLFLAYSFFYVARQRNDANERAFRLLRIVDDQLMEEYRHLDNPFGAALVAPKARDSKENTDDTTETYLRRALEGGILDIKKDKACHGITGRNGKLTFTLVTDPVRGLSLRATFKPDKPDGNRCSLSATLDYGAKLRERFQNVTQDYFDDILIATTSGEVVFQKNATGLRVTDLNALFPAEAADKPSQVDKGEQKKPQLPAKGKPAAFQVASQVTNVRDVEIAGAKYRLYLQPAPLEILKPSQETAADGEHKETKVTLVVCGLWRSDRLESEVVSIRYTALIWGTLLLLAAFALLWPLLKVAYMSPSERLRRRHVFYLLSSALLVTALLTVIVLNYSYSARDDEESQEELAFLANQIDQNLRSELTQALVFMDALGKDNLLHERFRDGKPSSWNNFLESGRAASSVYPYFDSVSWVDKEGHQAFKVTVQSEAPAAEVKDRDYFQDVLHQRHLMNAAEIDPYGLCPYGIDCNNFRFRFDSVHSKNTGEFLIVLAKPYQTPEKWKDDLPALSEAHVQVMTGRFVSLLEPMLPAGFGFAVVNRDGTAQFHSTAARSGVENFFKECHQNPSLQALVRNGLSDHLEINYLGKRHQVFVKPLPYLADPAPALVVFRDANYFSTINVACFLVFALLAGLFSIPFLVGLAVCVFRPRDYPLETLWPTRKAIPKYVELIAASLCLTVAFALRFSSMRMNETLIDILAMSAATVLLCLKPSSAGPVWNAVSKAVVVVAILVIAGRTGALAAAVPYIIICVIITIPEVAEGLSGLADRRIKLRYAYLGMVLSLLTVIVVLPSFGLFRISYNTVNRLSLQNAQLARRDQLIRRGGDIQRHAPEIKDADKLKSWVEHRMESKLDRYDNAVFFPKDEDGKSWKRAQPDVSSLEPDIAVASGFLPSNRLGAELREIAQAEPGQWESAQDGDDERLWLKASPEDLLGVYPLWQLNTQTTDTQTMLTQTMRMMLLIAFLVTVLVLWLRYVIQKVFLTELENVPPLEASCPCQLGGRNLLIIGDSDSCEEASLPASPEVDVLDLEQIATTGKWKLPELAASAVMVDHFEFDLDNPDTSLRKLRLLEQLRYVAKKHVILRSTVDPMFYLASADAGNPNGNGSSQKSPIQFLDRWADVFNGFEKVQLRDATEDGFHRALDARNGNGSAELVEMISGECRHTPQLRRIGLEMLQWHGEHAHLSKGQFVDVLLDRADSYYRLLWSTCTKQERLVLYQLALDGWVNPKNDRAIQQLQRRGIIRRGSGYRLMNDSLRRFVHNSERPEEVAKWEEEEGNSAWSAMKLALGTGLMMCGAWLIYAQQDIFQLGIGYLTALGTASSAVISLTRNLKGKSGAASSA